MSNSMSDSNVANEDDVELDLDSTTSSTYPAGPSSANVQVQSASELSRPLSKNQQKKQAKLAQIQANKLERRAHERVARKEKRSEKRKLVEEEGADPIEVGLVKKLRTTGPKTPFACNIVIDLSFDDKMVEKVKLLDREE